MYDVYLSNFIIDCMYWNRIIKIDCMWKSISDSLENQPKPGCIYYY